MSFERALASDAMMKNRVMPSVGQSRDVYLDYAAATPVAHEVREAMLPYLTDLFHNPSAPYAAARRVRADIEKARMSLAHTMGARAQNIVLTAGATEANNLAFAAVGGHVVTNAVEHDSVLAVARARDCTVVGVGDDGRVSADGISAAISPITELVSVALANGEVGTIQPVREIAAVVAAERDRRLRAGNPHPIYLHTDASQAFGSLGVAVATLGVDMMTLSAAKLYGPKQVGLLWVRDGISLNPLVRGGGQEGGVRSGTENTAGIIGFARAAEMTVEHRKSESRRLRQMRQRIEREIIETFPWSVVSGPHREKLRLPGLLHVSFPKLEARRLVLLLERRGVSVGTGSACAASKMRTSHVLAAMGVSDEIAAGSLRISLGIPTTDEEISYALAAITDVVRSECQRLGVKDG